MSVLDESKQVVWRDIQGFEGRYRISNMGDVLNLSYKNSGKEKLVSSKSMNDGYHRVYLRPETGLSKMYLVHRLVAIHFLDSPKFKDQNQVNHIDGNKSNNNAENLEWVNSYENNSHARRTGLLDNSADRNGQAVLSNEDIPVIMKMLKTGRITQAKIAYIFNVTPMTISNIVNKKSWNSIIDTLKHSEAI